MAWVMRVDTHKDVHVAVVLGRLAVREFPATDAGNTQLVRWLAGLGPVTGAGVEGAGSYGYRLARVLADAGLQVWEINCPDRSRRRRKGKSDPVDAENAARTYWRVRRPWSPRTAAASPASCGGCCSPGAARSRPEPRFPTRSSLLPRR